MVDKTATFSPVCGSTAQFGLRQPDLMFLDHTHTHTQLETHTHPEGLLRKSDKFVAEAATYTTNTREECFCLQRDSNPCCSNQTVADVRLRAHGRCDGQILT
jgi:hypothetical protein